MNVGYLSVRAFGALITLVVLFLLTNQVSVDFHSYYEWAFLESIMPLSYLGMNILISKDYIGTSKVRIDILSLFVLFTFSLFGLILYNFSLPNFFIIVLIPIAWLNDLLFKLFRVKSDHIGAFYFNGIVSPVSHIFFIILLIFEIDVNIVMSIVLAIYIFQLFFWFRKLSCFSVKLMPSFFLISNSKEALSRHLYSNWYRSFVYIIGVASKNIGGAELFDMLQLSLKYLNIPTRLAGIYGFVLYNDGINQKPKHLVALFKSNFGYFLFVIVVYLIYLCLLPFLPVEINPVLVLSFSFTVSVPIQGYIQYTLNKRVLAIANFGLVLLFLATIIAFDTHWEWLVYVFIPLPFYLSYLYAYRYSFQD